MVEDRYRTQDERRGLWKRLRTRPAREIAIETRSEPPGKGERWRIEGGKGGDGRERQSQ